MTRRYIDDERVTVPELRTSRLVLSGHRVSDLDECAAMWGEPAVTRHIGGRPFTREDVWARILRYIGHWTALGYGFWIVRDRAGAFVGEVGIAEFKRDLKPPIEYPEAGWALASAMHGKGYATEAVMAALAWGEQHVGKRFSCMIEPHNHASIRVAHKCGFVEKRRTLYHGDEAIVFVR